MDEQTDRRTGMKKIIVAFRNFANALKNLGMRNQVEKPRLSSSRE